MEGVSALLHQMEVLAMAAEFSVDIRSSLLQRSAKRKEGYGKGIWQWRLQQKS
jgi:hypothetical protein